MYYIFCPNYRFPGITEHEFPERLSTISADFAEHNLKTLELSGKIESFLHIVECGHEFAKIYDFDDREIVPIREKFEEADELTWR